MNCVKPSGGVQRRVVVLMSKLVYRFSPDGEPVQQWRGSDWPRSQARPAWDNTWLLTQEQTIETERMGLPKAYPRRNGKFLALKPAKVLTPRSTYQEMCHGAHPNFVPQRPQRPQTAAAATARPNMDRGGISSTYRDSYLAYAFAQPRPVSARGPTEAAAGRTVVKEESHMLCWDDRANDAWAMKKKVRLARAQLQLEKEARREREQMLRALLKEREVRRQPHARSRQPV